MAFIAHNRKCNLIGRHGHVMKPGQWVKRPLLGPIPLKAVAGWTGAENCYIPTQAYFGGNTGLYRIIPQTSGNAQGMISMWIRNDAAAAITHRVYDIGASTGPAAAETTRLQIDASGQIDTFIANSTDGITWERIAVNNNLGLAVGEWHHYFMTYKNNTVDGTSRIVTYIDGVLVGDQPYDAGDEAKDVSFFDGDSVTIGCRHDVLDGLASTFVGAICDIWTSGKYLDPDEYVQYFRSNATNADFVNGTPRPVGSNVNGNVATSWMGGQGYTLADWNDGLNRGASGADFTLVGDPIVEPA